jgi:aspartyl-tRNA(Asn)/glutamyl-tRNA(Gln) amidotransferase subunit B
MKGLIGLEIHTYLVTKEKLFCRCAASREKGLKPNVNICPICTGQPGAKPMAANAEAVHKAVMIARMLGCEVNERMKWMRKHYDWPDMPKGYQTTMSGAHATPLGVNGNFDGIEVSSMHLEEDPASWDPSSGCVDYNRSGLPLVEIVTAPAFHYAEEVGEWLQKLTHALAYLKVADSNAGIKCDVNVNIPGKTERVEVKNISSVEAVMKAINYELQRQNEEGSVRETRRYDDVKGKTIRMRSKEAQDDYRFIADPDLQAVAVEKSFVKKIDGALPEMPEEKLKKLVKKYKIDEKDAAVLAKHLDIAIFFEEVAAKIDGGFALPWVTIELFRVLNWNKKTLAEVDIKVEHFVALLNMVKEGKITELQAKQLLNKFVPASSDPTKHVQEKMDDAKELKPIIEGIIKKHKDEAERYKKGEKQLLNFLMGEVMKATNRRADFRVAKELLEKLLA